MNELPLTEKALAAGYTYLREWPPFNGWGLQPACKIKFQVVRTPKMYADFSVDDGQPVIRVSVHGGGHSPSILADLAHEMIHLHQHNKKLARGVEHNADFRRRKKVICAIHGFDPRTF